MKPRLIDPFDFVMALSSPGDSAERTESNNAGNQVALGSALVLLDSLLWGTQIGQWQECSLSDAARGPPTLSLETPG